MISHTLNPTQDRARFGDLVHPATRTYREFEEPGSGGIWCPEILNGELVRHRLYPDSTRKPTGWRRSRDEPLPAGIPQWLIRDGYRPQLKVSYAAQVTAAETELEMVRRHARQGAEHVAWQRALIARLTAIGLVMSRELAPFRPSLL